MALSDTNLRSLVGFIKRLKQNPKDDLEYEFFFRGHSDENFDLKPSIYRNSNIDFEDIIFKELIIRTPQEFVSESSTFEKLVKMQHYGLPTRLLDVTTNPLVALYFACNEFKNEKDGEVIVFKIPKKEIKYYDSDTVCILSNISKRPKSFRIDNLDLTDKTNFNNEDEITLLLHEIKHEKPQFLPVILHEDLEKVLVVKAKYNNARIIKQSGAFLIFGINKLKSEPAIIPDHWILNALRTHRNFKILKESKSKIIGDLDALGINESFLFPELEKQAHYIKEKYLGSGEKVLKN